MKIEIFIDWSFDLSELSMVASSNLVVCDTKMSEIKTSTLKETLAAQQQLLQKLYHELDVEREASSSAASEALSMILRLQGEKAAVKMEAEQYKRLAEEKMCYAEQSLEIFEDLIYQKEMEIAALDYQVQAYRYKLLSLGCSDLGVGEIKFPENLLQRNETLIGETSAQSILRINSAPPGGFKLSSFKRGNFERERCQSPDADLVRLKVVKENPSEEVNDSDKHSTVSATGNINSYLEQIRELDERVRQIAGEQYANLRSGSKSPSLLSQESADMACDAMKGTIINDLDQSKPPQSLSKNEVNVHTSCFPSVHDVFEVPQSYENLNYGARKAKPEGKLNLKSDERSGKPDLVPAVKLSVKDKSEISDCLNEVLLVKHCEPKPCLPHEGMAVDCNLAIVGPTIGVPESHVKFQQVNRASEIVEIQSRAFGQESTGRGEEELKLLNEIREQLNSIQSEIRTLRPKKSSPMDNWGMHSLGEVHFFNLFPLASVYLDLPPLFLFAYICFN